MKLDLSFWTNASQRRKRIYSIIAIFIIAVIVTVIGSFVPLSSQDAYQLSNQLNQTLNENKASNTLTQYIFLNNFEICLLMFVPVVGAALGMFILFDTGLALGAIATTQGYPVLLGLASLIVTPVFWIEFAAYSIAMAESIWLVRRLIQAILTEERGRWREILWRELKWTGLSVAACAGLLAIGAVVEVWIITVLG
jgi:uncharacterized membrane protein SpoIIM required for sporulation